MEMDSTTLALLPASGLLSGTAATMVMNRKGTRLWVLVSGLVGTAVDFIAIMALGLMTNNELSGSLVIAAWRAGGSAVGTLLCIAVQPLLEMIFNLPTPMKLMELSNPNQPLLRRLLLEAPGTYHHSTIVSSLAEAAAEAIGANPLLARVGGYYHDIGKLKRPGYFKENQNNDNPHERTDPYVSAAILISHTMDGVLQRGPACHYTCILQGRELEYILYGDAHTAPPAIPNTFSAVRWNTSSYSLSVSLSSSR